MKRTQSQKNSIKINSLASINALQDRLFSKIKNLDSGSQSKFEDLDVKLLNDTPDALTQLIYKAKGITAENQDKIKKAKRQIRVSKKQTGGTFLTGTGIYTAEVEQQPQPQPKQEQPAVDHEQMLRNLTKKNEYDDLAQLRRMIKMTDQNLGGYSRQVHQIKKQVLNAAQQFKNPMSFDLTYKLNRLEQKSGPNKKSHSTVKLNSLRYN